MFPFVAQTAAHHGIRSSSECISIVASTLSCVGHVDSVGRLQGHHLISRGGGDIFEINNVRQEAGKINNL